MIHTALAITLAAMIIMFLGARFALNKYIPKDIDDVW